MKARQILVTGGAGFIGSHLVDALIERGAQVKVIDDLTNGKLENLNKNAQFKHISILDRNKLRECVSDVEIVFHLAARREQGKPVWALMIRLKKCA